MITTISLVTTITICSYNFFLVMITFKIYCLSNLQICSTVLTIVTKLYIIFAGLIYFITGSLYPRNFKDLMWLGHVHLDNLPILRSHVLSQGKIHCIHSPRDCAGCVCFSDGEREFGGISESCYPVLSYSSRSQLSFHMAKRPVAQRLRWVGT